MSDAIHNVISILLRGGSPSENEMRTAVLQMMDGGVSDVALGMLLTGLKLKVETADELVGAALALRERATRIPTARTGLLDTCGTGGDALCTFNISTAAAIVTASCGVPVAKHGNRSVSSRSGSADVLESLGVRIELAPEQVGRCIDEVGLGFCFAPLAHAATRHAAGVRKALGFRTIFNLLGPLTNPAGAEFQLVGASRIAIAEKMAAAIARLGSQRALVVCGNDELDEVSLWGTTTVFQVDGGRVDASTWTAKTLGLAGCRVDELQVASPAESAGVIRGVLAGAHGPTRDIVVANAAAALLAAGESHELGDAVAKAADAIDAGRASSTLDRLIEFTSR